MMNKRLLTLLVALSVLVTGTKAQSDSETMLTLEALEATTVTIKNPREITSFYYQKNDEANGVVLTTVPFATNVTEISLDKGDKLKLFGICPRYGASENSENTNINCSGDCYIYGNIMSLFNVNTFPVAKEMNYKYTFAHLFKGNTHIKNHPSKALVLPATTLTEYCYKSLFEGCSGLTKAPALPATTLAEECYYLMFYGCTGLKEPPALPATTLASYCYSEMFRNCSSLEKAPDLPATTLAVGCYNGMFSSCSGLKVAPALPAMSLADACYSQMFYHCGILTEAPDLSATKLAPMCYSYMFQSCFELKLAPLLPATKLEDKCYEGMFKSCSKLINVSCMAAQLGEAYSSNWLSGVAPSGTFTKNLFTTEKKLTRGVSGIPTEWTLLNDATELVGYDLDGNGTVDDDDIQKLVDYIMNH